MVLFRKIGKSNQILKTYIIKTKNLKNTMLTKNSIIKKEKKN